MSLEIFIITPAMPEYTEVYDLREEVLRKPIGLSLKNEDLGRDHTDVIMVGKQDGRVVACLMLHHVSNEELQLRQMAVAAHLQGHGLGRQLVQAAEQHATAGGYRYMMLHARRVAMGFYESMGYAQYGDEFMEVGLPHYEMKKAMG